MLALRLSVLVVVLAALCGGGRAQTPAFSLSSSADAVAMGQSVILSIAVSHANVTESYRFWPFVNNTQWGAYVTCAAPCSNASLIIPLPAGMVLVPPCQSRAVS
jgi:hypothetical protein